MPNTRPSQHWTVAAVPVEQPPDPPSDDVFPQEVYAIAQEDGRHGHYPAIYELDEIPDGRRVAVYVLKEIKQLKFRRELI